MTNIKNIERVIHLWDLHWSAYFLPFIEKYRDGKTLFLSSGDIFDRGPESFAIMEKIKELHKAWEFDMVLWNHCLFFVLWLWLSSEWDNSVKRDMMKAIAVNPKSNFWNYQDVALIFQRQFFWNWWNATMNSFEKGYWKEHIDKWNENISYLWDNFGLVLKDPLWNLVVHWGLPILPDGSLVGEYIDDNYVEWIDYLYKSESKLKALDYETLKKYTATYDTYANGILRMMEIEWKVKDLPSAKLALNEFSKWFFPTWYDSGSYETIPEVKATLEKELDKHWLDKLVVGHFWNTKTWFENKDDLDYKRALRIDRSYRENGWKYGNFGFAVLDKNNNLVEINDVINIIDLNKIWLKNTNSFYTKL